MTYNQRQVYLTALYRFAASDNVDLDMRYAMAREMQRQRREPTTVSREMLFSLQRAYRKAVHR